MSQAPCFFSSISHIVTAASVIKKTSWDEEIKLISNPALKALNWQVEGSELCLPECFIKIQNCVEEIELESHNFEFLNIEYRLSSFPQHFHSSVVNLLGPSWLLKSTREWGCI